jgi:prepilin-type N-terminal cleavage/methylation domain-containing protein
MPGNYRSFRKMPPQSEVGFSLVEVLLAITILSVGMLGTAALSVGVIRANTVGKDVTIATALAQDKMEAVRNAGYMGLPSAGTTVTEDYGSIVASVSGMAADYARFRRITQTQVDTPAVAMKKVTVSVLRRGGQSPIVLTTILSR